LHLSADHAKTRAGRRRVAGRTSKALTAATTTRENGGPQAAELPITV
jgi:hypothetical protein